MRLCFWCLGSASANCLWGTWCERGRIFRLRCYPNLAMGFGCRPGLYWRPRGSPRLSSRGLLEVGRGTRGWGVRLCTREGVVEVLRVWGDCEGSGRALRFGAGSLRRWTVGRSNSGWARSGAGIWSMGSSLCWGSRGVVVWWTSAVSVSTGLPDRTESVLLGRYRDRPKAGSRFGDRSVPDIFFFSLGFYLRNSFVCSWPSGFQWWFL